MICLEYLPLQRSIWETQLAFQRKSYLAIVEGLMAAPTGTPTSFKYMDQINKDILRTMTDFSIFHSDMKRHDESNQLLESLEAKIRESLGSDGDQIMYMSSMRRILFVFSVLNPGIGKDLSSHSP